MSEKRRQINEFRESIVKALNFKDFYGQYLDSSGTLREEYRDGWSNLTLCPIHNDQDKPNFQVNLKTGAFNCHACGSSGSVFDFWCIMNKLVPDDRTNFVKALKALAEVTGVRLTRQKPTSELPDLEEKDNDLAEDYTPVPKEKINKEKEIDSSKAPIKKIEIEVLAKNLTQDHYKFLSIKRGINDETIVRYHLGYNPDASYKTKDGSWNKGKICIPIENAKGEFRNIRLYHPDADPKITNLKGYGTPSRLFPIQDLIRDSVENVILVEGEFDALVTMQNLRKCGLGDSWCAVTSTHGCNNFSEFWLPYFYDKHVIIMFDADDPGQAAASNIASAHFLKLLTIKKIKSLKIVIPPKLDGTKEFKDATDYFVKLEGTVESLIKKIKETQPLQSSGPEFGDATVKPIEVDSFVKCIKDREYVDKRVTVPITISGQSNKTYHATRTYKVIRCPLQKNEGQCCNEDVGIRTVPLGHPLFIRSSMASQSQINEALRTMACTEEKKCTTVEVQKVVMEEFYAHQVIKRLVATRNEEGRNINAQELVQAPVYVLQPENNIEITPQNYMATGYVRSHPVTRQATLFVEHLEPLEEDWKSFIVNEETIPHLKVIQEYPGVMKILNEITLGVTQIYKSNDILLSVLLTYLSPLWIAFNGQIMRGWMNICILGDSGTGKSATYESVSDWLDLGDLFSGLSGTRTGLIYTIKQRGVEWYVQIGRYVMSSGKILAVDEVQELEADEIKKMAIAMDKGWLEVSQVASGGYSTKVRTLFLMNPKRGKKISDFAYGCQAIAECFHPMFIRRIDLAVFTASKEEVEFYNKKYSEEKIDSIKIKPKDLKTLIHWAWTRDIENINWTDEATQKCLDSATDLVRMFGYADDIPLVSPQDFRNNLARLSTAFAILDGSFTEDYTGVVIKSEHVEKMSKFIDTVYSSSNCNLKHYSKNSQKKKTLVDYETIVETFDEVIKSDKASTDRRWSEGQHFLQMLVLLQQQQFIRKADLADQLGVGKQWVQQRTSYLQMYDLIEMDRSGYRTTRKFNLFMRKWQEDPEIEEMFDGVNKRVGQLAMLMKQDSFVEESYKDYVNNGDPDPFD